MAISMDGKGAWRDNVFVERLWKSVKYEEVYLHAYANGTEARTCLTRYFSFYNIRRSHQALAYRIPHTGRSLFRPPHSFDTDGCVNNDTEPESPELLPPDGGRLHRVETIDDEPREREHHQQPPR